jgi:hypothetical protein
MATRIYYVRRWRSYAGEPQDELVLGNAGKPIAFSTAGSAAGAVGVLNINDPDWVYYSVPAPSEVWVNVYSG